MGETHKLPMKIMVNLYRIKEVINMYNLKRIHYELVNSYKITM